MTDDQRTAALALLAERGVDDGAAFVDGIGYEGVLATVAYFDDKPGTKGAGLLVHLLRAGDKTAYRRPGERTATPAREISPRLERAIRGSCLSPNGFSRGMARDMLAAKARHLGMATDALIDAVMGVDWQGTAPEDEFNMDLPVEVRRAGVEAREARQRAMKGTA